MYEIKKSIEQGFSGKPGGLYDILKQLQNAAFLTPTKVYYVFKGGNNTTGESWETAFNTLTEAITAQRAMRALQPSAEQSVDTYIIMAPATYAEAITVFPFSTTIIGLGVLGTDKSTEIHPEVGSCMAGTVSGLRMYNISFQGGTGTADTLDFNIFNNGVIEGCEFWAGAADSNAAISTQDCKNSNFINNRFAATSTFNYTYGFYFGGGADKYCHACKIEDNLVQGLDPVGTGLYIEANCVATKTLIRNNIIHLTGAGIGIDENSDNAIVIGNTVFTQAGTGYDCNEDLAFDNRHNNGTTRVYYPTQTINT